MKQIGINGFGRIGRYFTRLALQNSNINIAVVNDISDINILAHLLKYDSVHGKFQLEFKKTGNKLVFENGKEIVFLNESKPELIPWNSYGVQTVLESTGHFLTKNEAEKHLIGGAKKIIISAPAKDLETKTIVIGVNDYLITSKDIVLSNASCTTNSIAPIIKVILGMSEIEYAFINTIHSYTTDQSLHDSPHLDLRRARASNLSIIPTTTSAAKAITRVFPELEGKIGGLGIRVPVPNGSLTDLTVVLKKTLTVQEINLAIKKASENELKGIISYCDEPIVSVDVTGNSSSCVFDSQMTSAINNVVKIVTWYDNEAGYSNRLIDLINKII